MQQPDPFHSAVGNLMVTPKGGRAFIIDVVREVSGPYAVVQVWHSVLKYHTGGNQRGILPGKGLVEARGRKLTDLLLKG